MDYVENGKREVGPLWLAAPKSVLLRFLGWMLVGNCRPDIRDRTIVADRSVPNRWTRIGWRSDLEIRCSVGNCLRCSRSARRIFAAWLYAIHTGLRRWLLAGSGNFVSSVPRWAH